MVVVMMLKNCSQVTDTATAGGCVEQNSPAERETITAAAGEDTSNSPTHAADVLEVENGKGKNDDNFADNEEHAASPECRPIAV